jgi:hypothetical protein
MPFTRLQDLSKLVNAIDTAMARHDEQGLVAIRDLLPTLHETVDAVNVALGEVESLLFEGLRDEAIALHDPEFPSLAARLNLQDRAGWPELEQFFAREGIGPPPGVDFDTLSALESAHSELEPLSRILDKLRRMTLERAPLGRRLAVLRKLGELDPTKPVWAELIAAHEQVRHGELKDAVRQALAARDPAAISALHDELTSSGWSVPVPKEYVRATRGADAWLRLRDVVDEAEAAAEALEAWYARAALQPPTLEMVEEARQLRQRWEEARDQCTGCRAALAESPNVATLVRDEGLLGRLDVLPPRTQPVLDWLDEQDSRDDTAGQFAHACEQLEQHVERLPHWKAEAEWLASVAALQDDVTRLCREVPDLAYPEPLRVRVEEALVEVQSRASHRRTILLGAMAAGGALVVIAIGLVIFGARRSQQLEKDRARLEKIHQQALAGNFVQMPSFVAEAASRHTADENVSSLAERIGVAVDEERERREQVQEGLARQAANVETSRRKREERKGLQQLDAWPDDVPAAAKAWRVARSLGGDPGRRKPAGGMAAVPPEDCVEARHALKKEESEIEAAGTVQKELENEFRDAATQAFRDELTTIRGEVDAAVAGKDAQRARSLLARLHALRDKASMDKCATVDELVSGDVRRRVAPSEVEAIHEIETKLQSLIR